jgi:Nucleotidyltransferase domain
LPACITDKRNIPLLRPIGTLTYADSAGRLPRIGTRPPEPWLTAACQLADQYKAMLGDNLIAVALRGSVARDTMVTGASDIDLVLVTQRVVDTPARVIAAIMPDLPVDVLIITRADLFQNPRMTWKRFTLAFSGWTVSGEDVVTALPDPILGPHAVAHLHGVSRWSA